MVSQRVLDGMKQMIFERQWLPGVRLPSEQALCEIFGVSRVTIRNALLQLKALGLIETHLGDGSYVKQIDASVNLGSLIPAIYLEEDFESISEFRMEVESGAAAIAARRATKKDVARLKTLMDDMKEKQSDLEALAQLDFEFHYAIAHSTQNNLIIRTYEVIHDVYFRHMKQVVSSMGGELGLHYHGRIVVAIAEKNPTHARDIMHEHIEKNIEFKREMDKMGKPI